MKFLFDLLAVLPQLDDANTHKFCVLLEKYRPHLSEISINLYEKLQADDQSRFIVWFLKRWGKIDIINRVEMGLYSNKIRSVKNEHREVVKLNGTPYKLRDFSSQGHDFKLLGYDWFLGVHDVFYNQYEHKDIRLTPGDVIIDAGAFLGDTAVLFNHKLKGDCEIHCFELLDENLALFEKNLEINRVDASKVHINKLALADKSDHEIQIKAGATQGSTSIFGVATSIFGVDRKSSAVKTITLDDYVTRNNLQKIDFIKMDIEGAEVPALQGAMQTIRHFKPRLALCLYHKEDDVVTIPKLIKESGVPYRLIFKWVQLGDGWEAVILATPLAQDQLPEKMIAPSTCDNTLKAAFFAMATKYLAKTA